MKDLEKHSESLDAVQLFEEPSVSLSKSTELDQQTPSEIAKKSISTLPGECHEEEANQSENMELPRKYTMKTTRYENCLNAESDNDSCTSNIDT